MVGVIMATDIIRNFKIGVNYTSGVNYISGVLEHKWRASLKLHYC